ncbi:MULTISPECIES: ABC transporter ATP-binding protein [Psychrobacillus]|uniref:ABC transporter ATP-binding protein n=1 Tax=Psychrobacillus lasiicapitis TaxID=1636719 RepID=A0A544T347_9BACI|nr:MULTISPECIES: ABC transporter ATP-binding protein [Psychrobacillus]MDI2587596.1 ABC transporter ATP-binding protein [Psychrobacillus sp. NEAU-3TGS]TQR11886.1 ABC transporter ATP-binding protein [Psychrobacillus lasiicapitis]GGA20241.1 dipeptide/oligopeptide/nickel ABC transporter ATP-binding protein [Psychrobacillus lasiicapitis]
MSDKVLQVNDLRIRFRNGKETSQPIRGVNFHVKKGETLGIVGESGCGKSVTSLSVMGLLPIKTSEIVSGEILFNNRDISRLKEKEYRKLRGNEISMIFQEPMTSLNPVFTIGEQLSEPLRQHKKMSKSEIRNNIIAVLKQVGLPRAEQIIDEYPHQLSGGMRQRVMISLALLCHPKLMIADEPTTALDVTIQAQILELLKEIKVKNEMSLMLITHDLSVVAEMCDRVVVMYAGEVVEEAEVNELFDRPLHPYTQGLMKSLPSNNERKSKLFSIDGQVPKPSEIGEGCVFANRCPFAFEKCFAETPPAFNRGKHISKCWLQDPAVKEVMQNEERSIVNS